MSLYRDVILSHYKNPQNRGKLEHFTHQAEKANPTCGDEINMQILVEDDIIKDIRFDGKGCAISLASCSLLTDYLKGESLESVAELKFEDICEMLGTNEMSPGRIKCAILSLDVVKKALYDV